MSHTANRPDRPGTVRWSTRLGVIGFMFFLGKGLFWLAMLGVAWLSVAKTASGVGFGTMRLP
jgi:hypothetical protein